MSDAPPFDADAARSLRVIIDTSASTPAPATAAALERELEALYRSHFARLAGYFQRCGQSPAAAHDLAQDTFVSALRGLDSFRGQSKLSTWLWTIARNVLLGHVRSPKPLDLAHHDADVLDTLTDPAPNRLRDCDVCVRRGFARFAADHPERAQVLYLAIVEGWTREELAEFLGRSTHAATEYLSQCKLRLRPYIQNCRDD